MKHSAVIGTSCSGKTHFSKLLAETLGVPHVEFDTLYWGPDWTPKPTETFHELSDQATNGLHWVGDGNYSAVRDVVWNRADTLVWLNYPFSAVLYRALRRTLVRCLTKEKLYSDNQEMLYKAFLTRDSILLWVMRTYWKHRKEYPILLADPKWSHLSVIELRSMKETKRFLARQCQIPNG